MQKKNANTNARAYREARSNQQQQQGGAARRGDVLVVTTTTKKVTGFLDGWMHAQLCAFNFI